MCTLTNVRFALILGLDPASLSLSQEIFMTYKEKLNPWCIIRPIPNLQAQVVARFRRRVDAEGRLKILNRMTPNSSFEIVFDTAPKDTDSADGAAAN
jgi:hypothetical protein